jgi:ADP-heptose:LPS heptosyltransferase
MRRALLRSHNLLGDGLMIGPVAEEWYHQHGQEFDEIEMYVLPGYAAPTYKGMGVPWKIVHERTGEYDYEFNFDVNEAFQISDKQKCHLVESYAQMMGVVKPGGFQKKPNYRPPVIEIKDEEKNLVLVSMHSMSCASRENPPRPPNKMLPWGKWIPILKTLRAEYPESKIKILGAKEDTIPEGYGLEELHDGYFTGVPLDYLANVMKQAKMIINVDNGMGHLAAAVGLNEFLLVPACLALHYIVPWGHQGLRLAHVDPPVVRPAYINFLLQSAIKDWKEKESLAGKQG